MDETDSAAKPKKSTQDESTGFYKSSEDELAIPDSEQEVLDSITWTASEFIAHSKTPIWYVKLMLVTVLVAGLVFLFTRDMISTIVIIIAGTAMAAYGARQPRQLQYMLDRRGLTIAEKFFPYSSFRSYSINDEGVFKEIAFMPLKRFGQLTTVYIDPDDESKVINLLSAHLALDKRGNDPIDQLMRRIRF